MIKTKKPSGSVLFGCKDTSGVSSFVVPSILTFSVEDVGNSPVSPDELCESQTYGINCLMSSKKIQPFNVHLIFSTGKVKVFL